LLVDASSNAAAGPETIIGGSGNLYVIAGKGDNITGGDAGTTLIDDGRPGGGSANITGGAAAATIIGGVADTVTAGSGATLVNALAGAMSVTGGAGNTIVWVGPGDTVTGGSGLLTTDLGGGAATINLSAPNATITDGGIRSAATVTGFSQPDGDRVSYAGETPSGIAQVVATQSNSNGNTTIALPDGTTMTFIGVSTLNATFFK
jgi:hypothetical protein